MFVVFNTEIVDILAFLRIRYFVLKSHVELFIALFSELSRD